jgi:hypothetical protein
MIETLDLTKFKTGLELEAEFNRIIDLAYSYKLSHVAAEEMLIEIYDYGVNSKLFSISDQEFYMNRKNRNLNGSIRSHLTMAMTIKNCQKKELVAFLYCFKCLRQKYPNEKLSWRNYGSDEKGYIMIVNSKLRTVVEPDYEVTREDRVLLIESKTFHNPPIFKIANIVKYRKYENCYLLFKYNDKHYIMHTNGMEKLLHLPKKHNFDQNTVVMSEENINKFLENKYMKELINDR